MPSVRSVPVLALLVIPGTESATLYRVAANESDVIALLIGGGVQAIEVDGGSVLWFDEAGKNKGLATNLLATKIAHRLHAGLYPDDTINGTAVVIGEAVGPDGDLESVDVTTETLSTLREVGVLVEPA